MTVLSAFCPARSECMLRLWWRNSLPEGKGCGAAGGLPENTWSETPLAAGNSIAALLQPAGRVKQD